MTWTKCGRPVGERVLAGASTLSWLPSVAAVAELFDRGCVFGESVLPAARAVARAYDAGDRAGLDTDAAKRAAEIVMAVATADAVQDDASSALRGLVDAIAAARLASEPEESLSDAAVLPPLARAAAECLREEGAQFNEWSQSSKRRRFLYCLRRRERTPAAYTLASLLFATGACPLLGSRGRKAASLAAFRESGVDPLRLTEDGCAAFLRSALRMLREAHATGTEPRLASIGAAECISAQNDGKKTEKGENA